MAMNNVFSNNPAPTPEPKKKSRLTWRHLGIVAVLAATIILVRDCSTPASAQTTDQGRPDPTGQGRYTQFGTVVPLKGAMVLKDLPEGTTCAPAGEMVGVFVWNSTREGMAIRSQLTDKAEVAITEDGKIYLCKCVAGFNELFTIKEPAPTTPKTAPALALTQADIDKAVAAALAAQPKADIPIVTAASVSCNPAEMVSIIEVLQKNGRKNDMEVVCEGGRIVVSRQHFKHNPVYVDPYGYPGYYGSGGVAAIIANQGGQGGQNTTWQTQRFDRWGF